MPGMAMDPMMMSQMYNGFGGQGMGMNNMNMGMGFDAGQGAFGGINGQPAAWNTGQNKFNQNAYGNHAGMNGMGGDFGANAGYGGYNLPPHQGSYNQMHQHQYPNNDFHQGHHGQGFQYRGRGRGRGYYNAGRGRGGYHHYNQYNQAQGNQANNEAFHQQVPEITRRGSPSYGPQEDRPARPETEDEQSAKADESTNNISAEEQLNKELAPGDADDNDDVPKDSAPKDEPKDETIEKPADSALPATEDSQVFKTEPPPKEDAKTAPIETLVSDRPDEEDAPPTESGDNVSSMPPPPSPMIPTGPASYHADHPYDMGSRGRGAGRGFGRGISRGSGYLANGNVGHAQLTPPVVKPIVPPVAPKGLGVQGAPTAPKALREGQPNTGIRGFSIVGRASAAAQAQPNGSATSKRYARIQSSSHVI